MQKYGNLGLECKSVLGSLILCPPATEREIVILLGLSVDTSLSWLLDAWHIKHGNWELFNITV